MFYIFLCWGVTITYIGMFPLFIASSLHSPHGFTNLLPCCLSRNRFVVHMATQSPLFIASSLLSSQMATQSQLLCCLSRLHVVVYNVIQSLIDKIFICKNESDAYKFELQRNPPSDWRWLSPVIFLLLLFSRKLNIPIKAPWASSKYTYPYWEFETLTKWKLRKNIYLAQT